MHHRAEKLVFGKGTTLEITFQNGEVKSYDVSMLFDRYPQMKSLKNRRLFCSGRLSGSYGIIWNEDLDLEVEVIYEDGKLLRTEDVPVSALIGSALAEARSDCGITQKKLAELSGVDQSDISKIERGAANPSVSTIGRLAEAMDLKVEISFVRRNHE